MPKKLAKHEYTRQKRYRDKQKEKGFYLLTVLTAKSDRQTIIDFAKKLRAKHNLT